MDDNCIYIYIYKAFADEKLNKGMIHMPGKFVRNILNILIA